MSDSLSYRRQLTLAIVSNSDFADIIPKFDTFEGMANYVGEDVPDPEDYIAHIRLIQKTVACYINQLIEEIIKVGELD